MPSNTAPRSFYQRLTDALKIRRGRVLVVYANPIMLGRVEHWQLGPIAKAGEGIELLVTIDGLNGKARLFKPVRGDEEAQLKAAAEYAKNGLNQ